MLYIRMQEPLMGKKSSFCLFMWSLCMQKVHLANLIEPGIQTKREMDQPELRQMQNNK